MLRLIAGCGGLLKVERVVGRPSRVAQHIIADGCTEWKTE